MYDRFSLAELLQAAGFNNPRATTAFDSVIPHWGEFGLDADGSFVRKPDSLFMEAFK
jgi:hypothetical protein